MNLLSIVIDHGAFIVSSPVFSFILDAHGLGFVLFPALYA